MINWLLGALTTVLSVPLLVLGLLRKQLAFGFPSPPWIQRAMSLLNY